MPAQPQSSESMFARGVYTTTKVIGDSPENGEICVYVMYKDYAKKPPSELEAMLRAGQHPGKLVARFKEGKGIEVLDSAVYDAWRTGIRTELERQRDSKRGAERILTIYFLDEMLNPTSAESRSPPPQPASHHELL